MAGGVPPASPQDGNSRLTVFVIRRVVQSLALVVAMAVAVFFGVMVIGDPTAVLISENCTGTCYAEAVRALGLDQPLPVQFLTFLKNAAQGELGNSFYYGMPALQLIGERLPASLELAFSALLITTLVGIPLGMWAGLRPHSASGRLIMSGSILGFSMPTFWVGLTLIMLFSVHLGWFPSSGRGETRQLFGLDVSFVTADGLAHLALPAVTLSLSFTALVIRLTYSGVRETVLMDFVKFARAKGISPRRIVLVHVLKNILIPIITVLGLELGSVLGFAVVIEKVFAWPGMGKLLIDSINVLDRPVIVAFLIVIVLAFVIINLLVDIGYRVLDPRVGLRKGGS
jgi:peptide/nickel transport system permease protein